ncbi:phosphate signaling complex protein PhoU [Actinocatenispora rupis]|uniref:Phosphate-specific transport system accessory protein PhoU n=1 Tax=Actinocatenispora rupis TaxID=519421 RepID=A0A8J3J3Q7_9ACTN|nr:phosphate signaling complex protein PhoU [Actinocatenispora rupis]GID13628.1 phosphate transport system regulatory protein PhoU [Actinocatenispora rupis]
MRDEYRVQLAVVGELLSAMAEHVGQAMREASRGLLSADRAAADGVLADHAEVGALRSQVEERTYEVLALQAPVASDLRVVLTAQHVAADMERMGNLARHVARAALRRYPENAVVPELTEVFAQMSDIAVRMADKMHTVVAERDATRAAELDRDDDELDALHRRMFAIMFAPDWTHGAEAAVDAALLGRYYERYADHAVNAAAQVIYLVTGEVAAP